MAKTRTSIPKAVQEQVKKEYDHRCAICGGLRPQLHHIDENPSNHDPLNLLPLCSNCHLGDQHNPTGGIEIGILKLFRRYKDPTILTPQFYPLFRRMKFLFKLESMTLDDQEDLHTQFRELIDLVRMLEMGRFFADKLQELPASTMSGMEVGFYDPAFNRVLKQRRRQAAEEYRQELIDAREQIVGLLIELLRYQGWLDHPGNRGAPYQRLGPS